MTVVILKLQIEIQQRFCYWQTVGHPRPPVCKEGKMISRIALALAAVTAIAPALAQQYPVKPIRIIVPFTAGGPTDILARIVGQKLTESWGQQLVIENRAGASGTIGGEIVAKAPPDGYTVLLTASAHVIVPSLSKVPYDAIRVRRLPESRDGALGEGDPGFRREG